MLREKVSLIQNQAKLLELMIFYQGTLFFLPYPLAKESFTVILLRVLSIQVHFISL